MILPSLLPRTFTPWLWAAAAAAAAATCPHTAWAQVQPPVGAMTYAAALAGAAQPVPTLAQWGVVVLSLLMAPLAWRAARWRLASLVLAASPGVLAAALLVAVSWSGKAEAQGAVAVLLDSPAGGTADIPYDAALDTPHSDFMSPYVVRNTTGQALRVTGITLTSGHAQRSTMSNPPCAVGGMLAPGAVCHLMVSKPR